MPYPIRRVERGSATCEVGGAPNKHVGADRRVSQRFRPEDVPWISLVKANRGETARLVDISSSGMLLEMHARLQPGRKNIVLLGSENQQVRIETLVVRFQLVGLTPGAGPLYRVALRFTEELDLKLPAPVEVAAEKSDVRPATTSPSVPHLPGPFESLWATEWGAELATASHITEAGCVVEAPTSATAGQAASLSLFFSVARRVLLNGTVTHVIDDHRWAFRFANVSPEEQRALRVEIRQGTEAVPRDQAAPAPSDRAAGVLGVLAQPSTRVAILQTNHW